MSMWKHLFKTLQTNNIGIYDEQGALVASLDVHQLATPEALKRREGQARLIAAAPELLFQLLAASNYIDALGGDSKSYRAAIAKAEASQ